MKKRYWINIRCVVETVPYLGKNCWGNCDINDDDVIIIKIRYSNDKRMRRTLDHELSHASNMLIDARIGYESVAIIIERCHDKARKIIPWYT